MTLPEKIPFRFLQNCIIFFTLLLHFTLQLPLVFQPHDMHQKYPIQYYALYHIQRGVFTQGNISMFRNSSGNMSAGLANIDGIEFISRSKHKPKRR